MGRRHVAPIPQYPHEAEILAPRRRCRCSARARPGATLAFEVRPSVNLLSMTLEQATRTR